MPPRFRSKLIRYFSWALIVASSLALLGWLQARDPDCLLEDNGPIAQIRLCDEVWTGKPKEPPLFALGLIALTMALGVAGAALGGKGEIKETPK